MVVCFFRCVGGADAINRVRAWGLIEWGASFSVSTEGTGFGWGVSFSVSVGWAGAMYCVPTSSVGNWLVAEGECSGWAGAMYCARSSLVG